MGILKTPRDEQFIEKHRLGETPEGKIIAQVETCRRARCVRLLLVVGVMLHRTERFDNAKQAMNRAREIAAELIADSQPAVTTT